MKLARIALMCMFFSSVSELGQASSPDDEWLSFCQSFAFMARDLMDMRQSGSGLDDLIHGARRKQIAGNYGPIPLEIVIETAKMFSEVRVHDDNEGKHAAVNDAEAFHMQVCLERPL